MIIKQNFIFSMNKQVLLESAGLSFSKRVKLTRLGILEN